MSRNDSWSASKMVRCISSPLVRHDQPPAGECQRSPSCKVSGVLARCGWIVDSVAACGRTAARSRLTIHARSTGNIHVPAASCRCCSDSRERQHSTTPASLPRTSATTPRAGEKGLRISSAIAARSQGQPVNIVLRRQVVLGKAEAGRAARVELRLEAPHRHVPVVGECRKRRRTAPRRRADCAARSSAAAEHPHEHRARCAHRRRSPRRPPGPARCCAPPPERRARPMTRYITPPPKSPSRFSGTCGGPPPRPERVQRTGDRDVVDVVPAGPASGPSWPQPGHPPVHQPGLRRGLVRTDTRRSATPGRKPRPARRPVRPGPAPRPHPAAARRPRPRGRRG